MPAVGTLVMIFGSWKKCNIVSPEDEFLFKLFIHTYAKAYMYYSLLSGFLF